ncbi:MAG: hypothetical protein ACOYW9_09715 [Deinococcota bacterium]|uniref:hypothetical protein n=1 Tax=Allomeiothermus silvanus TaxID=52022 RepID=UPI0023F4A623|nr:hypothetical protein [Allomeiothermus silvanus]
MADKIKEAVKAVRSKVNEVADRARAKGHEVKADTSDNPVEKVVEKGKAAVDRAKAEVHKEASKTAAKKARR